jgi:hypothetical protein
MDCQWGILGELCICHATPIRYYLRLPHTALGNENTNQDKDLLLGLTARCHNSYARKINANGLLHVWGSNNRDN